MSFTVVIITLYTLVTLSSAIVVTKNSKQAVFITGDIGGSSLEIARKLSSYNVPVRALVPSNKEAMKKELDSISLVTVFAGDSTDEESVQSCLSDCIAAITMVNGKSDGDGTPKIDYAGNSNVVEQVIRFEIIYFVSYMLIVNYILLV